jgi:hypothetical protein
MTLATTASRIADYYNGMIIENVTDNWVDTISDYTAAGVITLGTQTLATSKYYGLVSELPEPVHSLIASRAVLKAKREHPASQEKPTELDYKVWASELTTIMSSYFDIRDDISIEEIFTDYSTGGGVASGVNIPGQGYTIY